MSTSSISLLALLVAGCSSVLGIEQTIADSDGDGIADKLDNCPDVANPSQFDSDNDGIGDACATCATPIGRDFDHDGYDDHCDRCIGTPTGVDSDHDGIDDGCETCVGGHGTTGVDVAPMDGLDDGCTFCRDPLGTDSDGDGLDDACDTCLSGPPHDENGNGQADACDMCPGDRSTTGPGINLCAYPGSRVLFEPFLIERAATWPHGAPGVIAHDVMTIDAPAGETYLQTSAVVVGQSTVTIKLTHAPVGPTAYVAIVMDTPFTPFAGPTPPAGGGGTPPHPVRCMLDSAGIVSSSSPTNNSKASTPIDVTQPVWLTLDTRNGIVLQIDCTATTADGHYQTVAADSYETLTLGIAAQGHVEVEWLDALDGPP